MRGRRSLIKQRSNRWFCNFQINGRRFRDSLGTDTRSEAETRAAELYAKARRGEVGTKKQAARFTLSEALGEWWEKRGAYVASASDIKRHSKTLIAELGGATALTVLSTRSLQDYVARRRVRQTRDPQTRRKVLKERANASINRELGLLRTVLIAARDWHVAVPEIAWKKIFLPEPDRKQTILSFDKQSELWEVLRPDFWPLIEFALLSGVRLENAIGLLWEQIDWEAQTITFRVKSKRPGGKLLIVPLTDAIAALLTIQRGHHPSLVFTYVCARNRHDPSRGVLQVKGMRYPFTANGWRKEWDRARCAIGLPALRFHDLRHTAATRAYQATGDLYAVKEMLGHADLTTTQRYAVSDIKRVRRAMEMAQKVAQNHFVSGKRIIETGE